MLGGWVGEGDIELFSFVTFYLLGGWHLLV